MEKCSRQQLAGMAIVKREKAARAWAPPSAVSRLRRLAADRVFTVRYLVAANLRTPQELLDRLAADAHPMVAWAARRTAGSPPDYQRIPFAIIRRIMHEYVDADDPSETVYQFMLLGMFDIDDAGRVWRIARMPMHRHGDPFLRLEHIPRKPGEQIPLTHYPEIRFNYHCLHIRLYSHRLVYRALKGKAPEGYVVHHIDHNKRNNHPDNLELLGVSDHARLHVPCIAGRVLLTPDQVREIRRLFDGGATTAAIARRYGISQGEAWCIKRRRCWRNVK